MKHQFERITPSEAGISSKAIWGFLDYAEGCGAQMHGLMILRHGKVAAEGWWAPYTKAYKHNSWSITKSYVATAVGVACDKGLLSLDDKVSDKFAEFLPQNPQPALNQLTIRRLLCMSCGMEPTRMSWETNWIKNFFETPIIHEPGSVFFYNNEASSLLAVIVSRATGQDFLSFLYDNLLCKLGIDEDDISCIRMKDGNLFGAAGLFSSTHANALLAQLYLQMGRWNGEQLLSEDWINQATARQIDVSFPKMSEMKQPREALRLEHAQAGYGFQMWMCAYPSSYRFDGAMGQYVIVLPTLDIIVAISESSTAAKDGPICMLNAVFDYLVPGVDAFKADEDMDTRLANRMRSLCMPRLDGCSHSIMEKVVDGKAYTLEPETKISLVPEIFEHITGAPPFLRAISLHFGDNECDFSYTDSHGEHALRVGVDGAARHNITDLNLPICGITTVQGVWLCESSFKMHICYPETCFSLSVTLDFDASTLTLVENLTFDGSPVQPRTTALTLARITAHSKT